MAYIGRQQDGFGVRSRFIFTATGGQTTFTTDDSSNALSYSDGAYVDVYLNGVLLDPSDYTATSLTSIVLDSGASANDVLEVIVYDVFSVFSGTFTNGITASEATVTGGLRVDEEIAINTTVKTWDASTDAIQFQSGSLWNYSTSQLNLDQNVYYNGAYKYLNAGAASEYSQASGAHFFKVASTGSADANITFSTALTVANSGNVGVGTSSPSTSLDVVRAGVQPLRVESSSGTEVAINMVNTGGNAQIEAHNGKINFDVDGLSINTNSMHDFGANNHEFQINGVKGGSVAFSRGTNGATEQHSLRTSDDDALRFERGSNYATESMRIDTNGNVGIGTTDTASARLRVEGGSNSATSPIVDILDADGTVEGGSTLIRTKFSADTSYSNAYYLLMQDSGGTQGIIYGTGDGTVTYATSSDERRKQNITDTASKWATVKSLQVRDYEWISTGNSETGFIAQELNTYSPSAVKVGGDDVDTDPWLIDYGRLTPILTKALQEAMERIETLEARLTALEA